MLSSLFALALGSEVVVPMQGWASDAAGAPIDGARQVTFRLYGDGTGAPSARIWAQTVTVHFASGAFSARLLSDTAFFAEPDLHATITIADGPESAPTPVDYAPRAAWAIDAASLGGVSAGAYARLNAPSQFTTAPNFSPSSGAPFTLGGGAAGQLVPGLNTEMISGQSLSALDSRFAYTAGVGLSLTGRAFALAPCGAGEGLVWSGSAWTCTRVAAQVASAAPTCDAAREGGLYFNTSTNGLQVCVGGAWRSATFLADGTSSGRAASSCAAIRQAVPESVTGLYWIKPAASTQQVWCEFPVSGGATTLPAFINHANLAYYYDFAKSGGYDYKRTKDQTIPSGRLDANRGVNIFPSNLGVTVFVPYQYGRTVLVRATRTQPSSAYSGFMFGGSADDDGIRATNGGLGTSTHGSAHALFGTLLDNLLPTANVPSSFAMEIQASGASFSNATTTFGVTNVGPGVNYDVVSMSSLFIGPNNFSFQNFSGGDLFIERVAVFNADLTDAEARAMVAQLQVF